MDEEILTEEELKQAVQKVFKRAQTDAEFRALCLKDPREGIRRVSGKAVPADLKIEFLDPPPDGKGG